MYGVVKLPYVELIPKPYIGIESHVILDIDFQIVHPSILDGCRCGTDISLLEMPIDYPHHGINLYASCHAKDLDMPNLSCFLDNLSIVATILCFILSWWAMHWHKAYMSA